MAGRGGRAAGAGRLLAGLVASCVALCPTRSTAAEGVKVEVHIQGLSKEMERNVTSSLSLAGAAHAGPLSPEEVQRLFARAPEEVARALEPFGYYRPQVRDTLEPGEKKWHARLAVDPGPPLLLDSVTVIVTGEGSTLPRFRRLVQQFPLKRGSRLEHPPYEALKLGLIQAAADSGYLAAQFLERRITIDRETYRARLKIVFDTGPRYEFGPVQIVGSPLDSAYMRTFVPFKPGDPYSGPRLTSMQDELSRVPYFERVEVEPHVDQAESLRVPITVTVAPGRRLRYTLGAGYGTDTGPQGTGSLEFRRLNKAGHRAAISAEVGTVRQELTGLYQLPHAFGSDRILSFSAGIAHQNVNDGNYTTGTAGVSLSRWQGQWQRSLGLRLLREQFEVGLDAGIPNVLIGEFSITNVERNDAIYATRGRRLSMRLGGSSTSVLSDVTYGQVVLETKWIQRPIERLRLLVRAEGGYTGTDDFHALPTSIRFFAGGASSVRAYNYQQLGIVDSSGTAVGGPVYLFGNVELERLIFGGWGLAVFYDIGNAMDKFSDPLAYGAGAGVRWRSPVGMVRLDFAQALDDRSQPLRVQFAIGPDL